MGIEFNNTPDKYKNYEKYTTMITRFKTIKSCKVAIPIATMIGSIAIINVICVTFDMILDSDYTMGDKIGYTLLFIGMAIAIGVSIIEYIRAIIRTMHNISVEELIQKDIAAGILIRTEDGQLIRTEDLYKNDNK